MDTSFISYFWLCLALLSMIISFFVAFKNFGQKTEMTKTITIAIGMVIFGLFVTLSVVWNVPTDILNILFVFGIYLIFILIYVLVTWINDQLFGDFYKKQNYSELFSFENKHKNRRSKIIKEKQNNKLGDGQ